jgi:hypothetical protein
MQRSLGVTLIAILSLIGSVLCLCMAALVGFVMSLAPGAENLPGSSPASLKAMFFLAILMYVLLAVWGISSSIGLFRLRNWARISTILFSVLLAVMGGFSGLGTLLVAAFFPISGPANSPSMKEVFVFIALFWFALTGIGIWWAVFLNRAKVKVQFAAVPPTDGFPPQTVLSPTAMPLPSPASRSHRPVSITVIAWLLLVGCPFLLLGPMLHMPAILFTKILTGWPSIAFYLVFVALNACIGVGLLRLKEDARKAAIAAYVFGLVNSAVFNFAPGGTVRMRAFMDMQTQMFPWTRTPQSGQFPQFDPMLFMKMGAALGTVAAVVPLYFLVTRKHAFAKVYTADSPEAS